LSFIPGVIPGAEKEVLVMLKSGYPLIELFLPGIPIRKNTGQFTGQFQGKKGKKQENEKNKIYSSYAGRVITPIS
jgi:hypothetical protein